MSFIDDKYKTKINNGWVVTFTKIDHEIEIPKNKDILKQIEKAHLQENTHSK